LEGGSNGEGPGFGTLYAHEGREEGDKNGGGGETRVTEKEFSCHCHPPFTKKEAFKSSLKEFKHLAWNIRKYGKFKEWTRDTLQRQRIENTGRSKIYNWRELSRKKSMGTDENGPTTRKEAKGGNTMPLTRLQRGLRGGLEIEWGKVG